jgi:prophage regulatory protein
LSKHVSITPPAAEPTLYSAEGTRLVRLPEVIRLTGTNKATIYNWTRFGKFPRPLKLGPRAVAWRYADVKSWLDSREVGGGQDLRAGGR